MKELAFRAWDKDSQKMYDRFHYDNRFAAVLQDTDDWNHMVLMQYTGLKDKNSVPIYEGDILGIDNTPLMAVRWVTHESESQDDSSFTGFSVSVHEARMLVVLGNIYENPELLA